MPPSRYPWLMACLGLDPPGVSILDPACRPAPPPPGWRPPTWAERAGEPENREARYRRRYRAKLHARGVVTKCRTRV